MSDTLDRVIQDLRDREEVGLKKYGTTVDRTDITPEAWRKHLYEELLDAAVYLRRTTATEKWVDVAVDTFGSHKQMTKAIEEMAELQKELSKHLCEDLDNEDGIREEIADVLIMMEQLVYLFDINGKINEIKQQKIERLKLKMQENESDTNI